MTTQTAEVKIHRFEKPDVPPFPVASFGMLFGNDTECPPSVLDAGHHIPVTTGRMGLSLAMEHMGIKPGEKVLIPAYHCNSMVEPVVNAGAKPVFFKIDEEAKVDLEDVARRLDEGTRVLLVTHYFGFPQNLSEIRAFCDRHGLVLIEDCAHVFFGVHGGKPIGSWGDYAFASPMKFFSMYDGGFFISSRYDIESVPLTSAGLVFDVKAFFTIVERALAAKRFGAARPLIQLPILLKDGALGLVRALRGGSGAASPGSDEGGGPALAPSYDFSGYFSGLEGEFDADWIHMRMSRASRFILKIASKSRVVERRRDNYRRLNAELSTLPRCRPLYPDLPETIVPYVYPLIVENPEENFEALKRRGLPISRFGEYLWRGFDRSISRTAVDFSRKVFQFPCYQELRPGELDWIIATIKEVLG
jgi:dTDP-4-amino-4,6-dideoxygalactose transaminase